MQGDGGTPGVAHLKHGLEVGGEGVHLDRRPPAPGKGAPGMNDPACWEGWTAFPECQELGRPPATLTPQVSLNRRSAVVAAEVAAHQPLWDLHARHECAAAAGSVSQSADLAGMRMVQAVRACLKSRTGLLTDAVDMGVLPLPPCGGGWNS